MDISVLARKRKAFRGVVVAALLAVVWNGFLISIYAGVFHPWIRAIANQERFHTTEGIVLFSTPQPNEDGSDFRPYIRYAFEVGGKRYESDRYGWTVCLYAGEEYVRDILAAYPPGKRVTVYYDSANPSKCALFPPVEPGPMDWLTIVFFQPFIVVGLLLSAAPVLILRTERRNREFLLGGSLFPERIPTWGRLTQSPDKFSVQKAPGIGSLALAFAGGHAVTCMVGGFLVVMHLIPAYAYSGRDLPAVAPKMLLMAGVVMGTLAAILLVWFMKRKARLEIDLHLGQLTLSSPRRNTQLDLREVKVWALSMIWNPRPWKGEHEMPLVPLLSVQTVSGEELPVHIFPSDEDCLQIAMKAAQVLGSITGKPAIETSNPSVEPGAKVSDVMEAFRRYKGTSDLT